MIDAGLICFDQDTYLAIKFVGKALNSGRLLPPELNVPIFLAKIQVTRVTRPDFVYIFSHI